MRIGLAPAIAASLAASLSTAVPAAAAPRTHVVVMGKMKFGPLPANVRKGDSIVWVNRDMFRHTATAANGSFDVDLPPGKRATTVIRSSGAVPFVCKYHPGMRGVLQVAPR